MFAQKKFHGCEKFYGRTGYLDDPLPNIVHIAIWMHSMTVHTMHPAQLCGGFRTFFLLSVWSPCYTLKKLIITIGTLGSSNFYVGTQNGSNL